MSEDRIQILSPSSSSECSDVITQFEDFAAVHVPPAARKSFIKKKSSRLKRSMTVHSPSDVCSDEAVCLTPQQEVSSPSRTSRLADGVRKSLRRPLRSISFSGRRSTQERRNSYGRSVSNKNPTDSVLVALQSLGRFD